MPTQQINYLEQFVFPTYLSYIDGLNISYNTSGSVSVGPGMAYVPYSSKMILLTGTVTQNIPIVSTNVSGSWQHVYLYESGGVANIQVTGTLPSNPYAGVARTKSGDTSMRYLGSVYCSTGGYLYKFTSVVMGNVFKLNWMTDDNFAFPFRIATGLSATTPTSIAISHLVPVTIAFCGLQIQMVLAMAAGGDMQAAVGDSIPTSESGGYATVGEANIRLTNAGAGSATLFLPYSEIKLTGNSVQYAISNVAGANTLQLRVRGINIQR